MNSASRTLARSWLSGLALAAVGVALARGSAHALPVRPAAAVACLGQIIAICGLLVIASGIRNRALHAAQPPLP